MHKWVCGDEAGARSSGERGQRGLGKGGGGRAGWGCGRPPGLPPGLSRSTASASPLGLLRALCQPASSQPPHGRAGLWETTPHLATAAAAAPSDPPTGKRQLPPLPGSAERETGLLQGQATRGSGFSELESWCVKWPARQGREKLQSRVSSRRASGLQWSLFMRFLLLPVPIQLGQHVPVNSSQKGNHNSISSPRNDKQLKYGKAAAKCSTLLMLQQKKNQIRKINRVVCIFPQICIPFCGSFQSLV